MEINSQAENISSQVFGKYETGFIFAGFEWSDQDESRTSRGIPKWGALSAPGKVRVRYFPGFRLWQTLGLMPKGLFTILLAVFLSACSNGGGGGGGVNPTPAANWTWYYSNNVSGSCDNFDFPQVDGAHMCVKKFSVARGQTITASFTISGSGTAVPVQSSDIPPATLRLFLWRCKDTMSGAGEYQQYRYWSAKTDLTPGQHTVSIAVVPENWTDVFGAKGSEYPGAFQATLNDLCGVGYSFGGQYFAAHGAKADGPVHFTLNQYTTGLTYKRKKHRR